MNIGRGSEIAGALLLCLCCAANAYAYLDLGSGSYLIQVALASVVGAAFALKSFWRKLFTAITSRFVKKANRESERTDT